MGKKRTAIFLPWHFYVKGDPAPALIYNYHNTPSIYFPKKLEHTDANKEDNDFEDGMASTKQAHRHICFCILQLESSKQSVILNVRVGKNASQRNF